MKVISLVRRTELFSFEAIKPFRTGLCSIMVLWFNGYNLIDPDSYIRLFRNEFKIRW